jgi:NodT family efflux transporter outer membrane factor (OMF) lipoprotein
VGSAPRCLVARAPGRALALGAALVFAGCTLGPNYLRPPTGEGEEWHEPLRGTLTSASEDREQLATWWQRLDDPLLDDLVSRAVTDNLDLRIARQRVRESRAHRDVAEAGLFPTLRAKLALAPKKPPSSSNREATGLEATWALDPFGALRRGVEAALGDLGASEEDLHEALVDVAAEVVQSYVDLRAVQARIAIAEQNLDVQTETAQIASWRAQAGLTTVLDVEQAQTNVAQTRAQIPALRAALEQAKNRLAILLGQIPGSLSDRLDASGPIPAAPAELAVGVPAEALLQRPDVRRAERALAAETARVGVAKAAAYPSVSLTGAIGTRAISPAPVASLSAEAASEFAQVIFDHGAIRARIEAQKAVRQESLARFRATALAALEDVEDGIAALTDEQDRRVELAAAAASAERAAVLSRDRYASGLVDFKVVLDAERSLYSLQDELVSSEHLAAADLVRLYRSLGGGWATEAT